MLQRPRLEARARRLLRAFEALDRLELVPMHRLVELACEAYCVALHENLARAQARGAGRLEAIAAQRTVADELRDQLRYHEQLLRHCFRGHPGLGNLARRPRLQLAPDQKSLLQ
jgi:hypothetical protein